MAVPGIGAGHAPRPRETDDDEVDEMTNPSSPGTMAEDYLKLLWKAEQRDEEISTREMARILGVSPSSVSGNMRKLNRDGLVDFTPYVTTRLTDHGRAIATRMVRRHRLLETYLAERLHYSWDEVHDEAEVMEHAVSDQFIDRIDAELGHPQHDPHGDPIPSADGRLPVLDLVRLTDATPGTSGEIRRVSDEDPEVLTYLQSCGLTLATRVQVNALLVSQSILRLDLPDGSSVDLPATTAESIWLRTTSG